MKTAEWGPITWLFIHVIVEKIIESQFHSCKKDIFEIIITIVNMLPCPFCREWAVGYLKSNPLSKCNSKQELKLFIYKMHNAVNAKLNKPIALEEDLERYKQYQLTRVYVYYINFYTKGRISKLEYGFNKILAINNIKRILVSNTNNFIN